MESITRSTRTRCMTTTVQMPIGYRFCPTDEEIIIHYLRPKVFSFPLPGTAILHSDNLFHNHPSQLPGDPKEKRYFFCKTSDTNNALNPSGYWKPILKNKNINTHNQLILATGCNHPIGFKNSFLFYQFSDHRLTGSKTPWILHQFRLLYPLPIKMEEWVVCSIHMKSKKVKSLHQGPSKKQKKSHSNNHNHHKQEEEDEDDELSGITFNDDLDDPKEDEEESKVN